MGDILRKIIVVMVVLMVSACATTKTRENSGAPALGEGVEKVAIPEDLKEKVEQSSWVGFRLYVYDTVAAIATDVLFANVESEQIDKLGGYLPLRDTDNSSEDSDAYVVHFFTDEKTPRIAYSVLVERDKEPLFKSHQPLMEPSSLVARLIRARQLAISSMPERVQPVNPVLLSSKSGDEEFILVYLLAGTRTPNVAVFGKHYRAFVNASGDKMVKMVQLSNSMLEVPTTTDNEEAVEALTVTHNLTDYPLETHVMTSLQVELPVYVTTKRGTWLVDGYDISLLKAPAQVAEGM